MSHYMKFTVANYMTYLIKEKKYLQDEMQKKE